MPRPKKDTAEPSSSEVAKQGKACATRRCNCNRLSDRIFGAIASASSRKGISLTALKKELGMDQYDVRKHNNRINKEVKSMVSRGALLQVSGRGASGTFRIAGSTRTGDKGNSKRGKTSTLKKTPGKKTKGKTRVSSRKSVSGQSQRKHQRQGSPSDKRSGRGQKSGAWQRAVRE